MRREWVRWISRTCNRRGLGVGVRVARNAVYSVLRRVGVFISGTGYRRRLHREYIGLRYRLVYVGAIAVLLRFVVMRLHVKEWEEGEVLKEGQRGSQSEGGESGFAVHSKVGASTWKVRCTIRRVRGRVVRNNIEKLESRRRDRIRGGVVEWVENPQRQRVVDEMERIPERGQYRYTEGRKYVWLAGRVRRVARRGAVVRTREEGGTKGSQGKGQRIGEQLTREGPKRHA